MSARERLLAALTVSPEVRPGEAEQLLTGLVHEGYPGELAELRGTLAAIRTNAQHGSIDGVRRLVTDYYAAERRAYDDQAGGPE